MFGNLRGNRFYWYQTWKFKALSWHAALVRASCSCLHCGEGSRLVVEEEAVWLRAEVRGWVQESETQYWTISRTEDPLLRPNSPLIASLLLTTDAQGPTSTWVFESQAKPHSNHEISPADDTTLCTCDYSTWLACSRSCDLPSACVLHGMILWRRGFFSWCCSSEQCEHW